MTTEPSAPVRPRSARHLSPDAVGEEDVAVDSAGQTTTEVDEAPSRGRHGGARSGGLTAAELIARARASAPAPESPPDEPTPNEPDEPAGESTPVLQVVGERVSELLEPEPMSTDPAVIQAGGRAGRNLPAAIGVGLALGALILVSLFAYRPSFLAVVMVAVGLGTYEMVVAISAVEARPPLVPLLAGGAAMELAGWFRGSDGLVGALLLTVIGVAIWRLADGPTGYLADTASAAFVAVYVAFLAGFAVLLAHPSDGAGRVVMFIVAVVCSDTGGYTAGVLAGRHPMAPTVSPKKSWEGFAGSVVACCLAGSLIMRFTFHHYWWQGALFGAAIAVTATLGDLGESMIKRDLAIKDMGRLLPGHGGIMDRLDSLLPCAAVAYLLLNAFVPA